MELIKHSKPKNLEKTLKISEELKNIGQDILNVINFIQLNRLALKQTLRNVDKEFHSFDSKVFKQFFIDYYHQKNSQLKHFFEHPGTLRAYFQLRYLVEVVRKGLQDTLGNGDYIIPKPKSEIYQNGHSKPRKVPKEVPSKDLFSYKDHMNEHSTLRNIETKTFNSEIEYQTNDVEMTPVVLKKDIKDYVSEIRANLATVEDVMRVQNHFFKTHKNTIFNKLDLKVKEYYNEEILENQAMYNYADKNLSKDNFIEVTLEDDPDEDSKLGVQKECYSMLDLYMVYLHTFLYLLNYYGMAQTSPDYSKALNLSASLSGVLQAVSPAAALFFGFVINCITKTKYKFPYLLCLCMLFVGNFLYFLAISIGKKSQTWGLVLLIAGRMIFGSGGSRLMTRKFIAINVPSVYQSKYSTYLVGFSALGITFGPGFSSLLEFINPVQFQAGDLTFYIEKYLSPIHI